MKVEYDRSGSVAEIGVSCGSVYSRSLDGVLQRAAINDSCWRVAQALSPFGAIAVSQVFDDVLWWC
jgi:hypothetical protein